MIVKHRTAGNQCSHRCPRLEPVVVVTIKHRIFCTLKGDRKISFVLGQLPQYHTRAISMNIVRAVAWTLHAAAQNAKGRLCGKRAGSPAALT